MSDAGEKTCPLCAEEMDLTDQQLKPCKCGYEICIWCWHHIIDMAEKDETEGRCPACRTPYNKEKVKGTEANCERIVAEMNMGRKQKTQKTKNKTSEGRKELSSVRVIQRNLVYIVGLPLSLADEDLMQRKEYFGQYGKVLKVSISRTAAGAIQQFSNNTCSIYITYSKEEEAVRCIQSVHGFVLEDRSLRACFGTTKYCHAWLRNMPCSNSDCLYLHEICPLEDSFSKDEIVSAYTRSRVQQITGATNNIQRRSGNVLPPPADNYCNNSSGSSAKPTSKSSVNNIEGSARGSPPNSSSGRPVALPAAASWGMRACNSKPLHTSLAWTDVADKQKADTCGGSVSFTTAVASSTQLPISQGDLGKKLIPNEKSGTIQRKSRSESLEPAKQHIGTDHPVNASEALVSPRVSATSTVNSQLYCPRVSKDKIISMVPNIPNSLKPSGQACGRDLENERNAYVSGTVQNLCSDMSSMRLDRNSCSEQPDHSIFASTLIKSPVDQGLPQSESFRVPSTAVKAMTSTNGFLVSKEQYDSQLDSQTELNALHRVEEEDVVSFDDQRLKDSEVVSGASRLLNATHSFDLLKNSRDCSSQHSEGHGSNYFNVNPTTIDKSDDNGSLRHSSGVSVIPNGYPENLASSSAVNDMIFEESYLLRNEGKLDMGRFHSEGASFNQNAAVDMGENSIISNILSMDFDPWDESLTSPQNLARLLGKTDKQKGCLKVSSSSKVQNSNQSRFSFARQDEPKSQLLEVELRLSNTGHAGKNPSYNCNNVDAGDSYFDNRLGHSNGFPSFKDNVDGRAASFDKPGHSNGFSPLNADEVDGFTSNHSHAYSNKFPTARAQMPAPPGFSMLSRAAPPGFSSQERVEQAFDTMSGNHLLDNSLLRNSYPALPTGNIGSGFDIEFMDPAILAVGKGRLPVEHTSPGVNMRSNFPAQISAFENEARFQSLMQRSFPPNQNHRFTDMAENFAPVNDAYGFNTRHSGIMEQSQTSNLSPYAQLSLQQSRSALMLNGHWDGWNEVPSGNGMGMSEFLRTERLGFNKFYTGYEDSKFQMSGSGNLYNRTFGI